MTQKDFAPAFYKAFDLYLFKNAAVQFNIDVVISIFVSAVQGATDIVQSDRIEKDDLRYAVNAAFIVR